MGNEYNYNNANYSNQSTNARNQHSNSNGNNYYEDSLNSNYQNDRQYITSIDNNFHNNADSMYGSFNNDEPPYYQESYAQDRLQNNVINQDFVDHNGYASDMKYYPSKPQDYEQVNGDNDHNEVHRIMQETMRKSQLDLEADYKYNQDGYLAQQARINQGQSLRDNYQTPNASLNQPMPTQGTGEKMASLLQGLVNNRQEQQIPQSSRLAQSPKTIDYEERRRSEDAIHREEMYYEQQMQQHLSQENEKAQAARFANQSSDVVLDERAPVVDISKKKKPVSAVQFLIETLKEHYNIDIDDSEVTPEEFQQMKRNEAIAIQQKLRQERQKNYQEFVKEQLESLDLDLIKKFVPDVNNQQALEDSYAFIKYINTKGLTNKLLLIFGDCGTGKTSLCNLIAQKYIQNKANNYEYPVNSKLPFLFLTSFDEMKTNWYFSYQDSEEERSARDKRNQDLMDVDLLIVDDFCSSGFGLEAFEQKHFSFLLKKRSDRHLPTVVTTSLIASEFKSAIGPFCYDNFCRFDVTATFLDGGSRRKSIFVSPDRLKRR